MPYNFSIKPGEPAHLKLLVRANADSYTLTAEFTKSKIALNDWYKNTEPVILAVPVVSNGNELTIDLTPEEIELIGKSYYRIRAVRNGQVLFIESGQVDVFRRAPSVEVQGEKLYVLEPGGGRVFAGDVGGPQGITGDKGEKGDKGDTGSANTLSIGTVTTALPGAAADAEIRGIAPNQILDLTIPHGEKGDRGPKGDKGDPGSRGSAGFQGIQGIQGPVGPAGLEWRGTWSPVASYAENDSVYYEGYAWFAPSAIGPNKAPSLENNNPWQPLAARGAQGIQGPQGIQGIQGLKGDKGDKGDQGNQGIQGIKGDKGDRGLVGPPGDWIVSNVATAQTVFTIPTAPQTLTRVLSGNVTCNALPTAEPTASFTVTVILRQATSGGPFTVTWPSSLKWSGNAPPPLMPTSSNAELVVHLFWSGQAWRGFVGGIFL